MVDSFNEASNKKQIVSLTKILLFIDLVLEDE